MMNVPSQAKDEAMTNMRMRGTRRQYFGTAIAAVYPSDYYRQPVLWQEPNQWLSSPCSPP